MYNFTQKLLQFLPLCTYTDILFNSTWSYSPPLRREYPWRMCPETEQFAHTNTTLTHQHATFSCLKQKYRKAHFLTPGCNVLPLKESLHALQAHGTKITYVGDSLSMQPYISLRCASEWFHVPKYQDISFQVDVFLRGDIPCDPRCLTDPAFRNNNTIHPLRHPCFACRDKDPRIFVNYASSPEEWHHKLPNATTALIIGSGAWYNSFKGIINSTVTYTETLSVLGPILQDLKRTRNIETFWQGLPPHNMNLSTANSSMWGYEWIYYPEKDALAKSILEPYGVVFIDTDKLTKERKARDPLVAADGLHWW